jgi:hypothetical protein
MRSEMAIARVISAPLAAPIPLSTQGHLAPQRRADHRSEATRTMLWRAGLHVGKYVLGLISLA